MPIAWVGLNAKLVAMPRREIVANRLFDARIEAEANSVPAIIKAFDLALGRVLRRLVEWTLVEGERSYSRGRPRLKPNT